MTTALSDAGVMFADGNTQATPQVPVRQTVLSGPVDTNGQSAFGGATGSTTVTATGTLVMTAANGNTNRTGTKVNPSWTGLSTNGTMYLYADVNADGTINEGVGTLAPIYQPGGTPANTAGLFTYNWQQNSGFIGTGASAPAGYRVYVGEVTVAGGVVTAIVWYALMGRYDSGLFAVTTSTLYLKNANLGLAARLTLYWASTSAGLPSVPEEIPYGDVGAGGNLNYRGMFFGQVTRNVVRVRTQDIMQMLDTAGNPSAQTTTGFVRIIAERRWL